MKKKITTVMLASILTFGCLSGAMMRFNPLKSNISNAVEETDDNDELFLNAEIRRVSLYDPVDNASGPEIGLQRVYDDSDDKYSVRFIAAMNVVDSNPSTPELEPGDFDNMYAVWYRTMFDGDGENEGNVIKGYAQKPSTKAYRALNANGSVYTIEKYNADHNTNYNCFVTYALKGIPRTYVYDYLVVGLLYGTGTFSANNASVSKCAVATVGYNGTSFSYDPTVNGVFGVIKSGGTYKTITTRDLSDIGSPLTSGYYLDNFGGGDEIIIVDSNLNPKSSHTYFRTYGYESSYSTYGYSRSSNGNFIQLPENLDSSFIIKKANGHLSDIIIETGAVQKSVFVKLDQEWLDALANNPSHFLQVRVSVRIADDDNNHMGWYLYFYQMHPYADEYYENLYSTTFMLPKHMTHGESFTFYVIDRSDNIISLTRHPTSSGDYRRTDNYRGYYQDFSDNVWHSLLNFDLTASPSQYGTVKHSAGLGYAGETVKITADPINLNFFDKWQDSNSNTLCNTRNYVFTMPQENSLTNKTYSATALFTQTTYSNSPVQSTSGGSVEFGTYPQSRVYDSTILEALNAKTEADIVTESFEYYSYNGDYYAKLKAKGLDEGRHSDDYMHFEANQPIVGGTTYWFKVEPVKWRVLRVIVATGYDARSILVQEKCIDHSLGFEGDYGGYIGSLLWETVVGKVVPQLFANVTNSNYFWRTDQKAYPFDALNFRSYIEYGHQNCESGRFGVTDYARANGVSVVNGTEDAAFAWGEGSDAKAIYFGSNTGDRYDTTTSLTYFGVRLFGCFYGEFTVTND